MTDFKDKLFLLLTGIATGLANGFFGGGGGMIVVPMLVLLLGFSPKTAHATAIMIILPISFASAVIYFLKGNFEFSIGIPVGIGVIIGGVLGALFLKKISAKWLVKLFSVVMLAAGIKLLFF